MAVTRRALQGKVAPADARAEKRQRVIEAHHVERRRKGLELDVALHVYEAVIEKQVRVRELGT